MSGHWLRTASPVPGHHCNLPGKDLAERGDVWQCDCNRMYIWSDSAGYGFEWRYVWFRHWWFYLRYGRKYGR